MRLNNRSRRQQKRRVPQLNTTSTADISFMLLIFFLVTTSMDPDKGLRRMLPPKAQKEVKSVDVQRDKILTISINPDGEVSIDDKIVTDQMLRKSITEFVQRIGNDHVIEIQSSRNADYNTYFHLQNLIVQTYRNELKGKYKQRISETFVDAQQKGKEDAK